MFFQVLSLGEDVLPNYIMDKKIGQEDRWIILHYSPFKVHITLFLMTFKIIHPHFFFAFSGVLVIFAGLELLA